jgi:hypothetical protein
MKAIIQPLGNAFLAISLCILGVACEPKKPARLELDPKGPFQMTRVGQTERVKPMAYDDKNRPFVSELEMTYTSSDASVATVAADGTISATGSGMATISAESLGVKAQAEVRVQVVGSVEIVGEPPETLKYGGKDYQLEVVVKDDKGNVIEKPKLSYSASDYCVEVSPTGLVHTLSEGKCDVIVRSANKQAAHSFDVR